MRFAVVRTWGLRRKTCRGPGEERGENPSGPKVPPLAPLPDPLVTPLPLPPYKPPLCEGWTKAKDRAVAHARDARSARSRRCLSREAKTRIEHSRASGGVPRAGAARRMSFTPSQRAGLNGGRRKRSGEEEPERRGEGNLGPYGSFPSPLLLGCQRI